MDNGNQFGETLEAYRLDRKWTLQRLAVITGVSVATISKVISGKTNPTPLTKRRIIDALPGFYEKTA